MSDLVCGPLPLVVSLGVFVPRDSEPKKYYIAQEPKAWPSHSSVSYSFLDGQPTNMQRQLVQYAIDEYTRYANVKLVRKAAKDTSADIRISFNKDEGVWSAIGIDALKIANTATMNLGFPGELEEDTKDDDYRRVTLHQFGHAFGLAHEWDSKWGQLSDTEDNPALQHHLAIFGRASTSNFTKVDQKSIMKFFVPQSFHSVEQKLFFLPDGLSESDKAWLNVIYPGRVGGDKEDSGILKSLHVLKVPLEPTTNILLASTVSEMRYHYHDHIAKTHKDKLGAYTLKNALENLDSNERDKLPLESHVLEGKVTGITPLVDHDREDDLYDSVAAAVLHPQFQQVLANVVNQSGDGRAGGIPGAQNGLIGDLAGTLGGLADKFLGFGVPTAAQRGIIGDITGGLGNLADRWLGFGVPIPNSIGYGINPQTLPPEVQQGIFNMFTNFMQSETFLKVVQGVATDMIESKKAAEKKAEEEAANRR